MRTPIIGWQTRPMPGQTTGCVLFADVSGSTKLYETVGDAAAHAAIDLCVKRFRALTEQHGGRVVKTIGDEVMAIFSAANPARGDAAARTWFHNAGTIADYRDRVRRILLRVGQGPEGGMGIKELFGKGKKKAEFREKAKEVLAKGKLTPDKTAELDALRKAHEIDDPGDDKTMLRREIYNKAAGTAKARGKLSGSEAAELAKIQKFLALRDDQVERTKWDLVRLRTLTEIRQGNLPVVPSANAALRGVQLEPGEVAHYAVQVEVFDRPSAGGHPGVAVKWGAPYVINSAKGHMLPVEGAKELGAGHLFITNRRLYFKGERQSAAVQYSPQADIFLYAKGLRLQRTVGHTLLKFKSGSNDTAEIAGELLSALMR